MTWLGPSLVLSSPPIAAIFGWLAKRDPAQRPLAQLALTMVTFELVGIVLLMTLIVG